MAHLNVATAHLPTPDLLGYLDRHWEIARHMDYISAIAHALPFFGMFPYKLECIISLSVHVVGPWEYNGVRRASM